FYQIARRIELAGLLYAACAYFSLSRFVNNDFFSRWLNPLIVTYSDGFSSLYYLRITFYTRVMWLCLSGGLWLLSLLCIRRYQKNLAASFLMGTKKIYLPVSAAVLIAFGVLLWITQPFVDRGPVDWEKRAWDSKDTEDTHKSIAASDSEEDTVSQIVYRLTAKPSIGKLHGIAEYTFSQTGSGKKIIYLNYGYKINRIKGNRITSDGTINYDHKIDFETINEFYGDSRRTWLTLPESGVKTLTIEYEGYPTMVSCWAPWTWGQEITKDHVSLHNGASVPFPVGLSRTENTTVEMELTLPGKLQPIVNHKMMTSFTENANGTKTWKEKILDDRPNSFSVWMTAADYKTDTFNAGGMDIDFIYSRKYESIMNEFNIIGALIDVYDYCTKHLGKLSWASEHNLMMLQRSEVNGGGNAGEGWVEWGEYIFTPITLSDPLKGASAAEVFVHEIVHQWWGGLGVFCGSPWDPENRLWSEEGLTVYTTYRLMKDKYGEEYAKKYYIDVWQAEVDIQKRGFYYRNPEYLDKLPERYRFELSSKFLNTNHYCRMPLMILKAEQLVGGEEKMDEILREVQEEYAATGNVFSYQDFLDYCGLKAEDLLLE
ncbi:MAG: hypothetical protein LBH42_07300, partial [Treponema sp.]|nr:hypothetical protein [Treponema sp.]